jgi:hypothetical protein
MADGQSEKTMTQTSPPIINAERLRAFVPLARENARAGSRKQADRIIPALTWTEGGLQERVEGLLRDLRVQGSDAYNMDAIVRAVMDAIASDDMIEILRSGIETRIYEHIELAIDLATIRSDPALAYASGAE